MRLNRVMSSTSKSKPPSPKSPKCAAEGAQRAALFLDMVFLQQDAFDDVDCACKPERQKALFDMVYAAATRSYAFKDKTAARDYFTKLTGLHKNLNYAVEGSNDFHRIARAIKDLDKSVPTLAANAAAPSSVAAASSPH
jgi:vacuolar-type H+-ATPase catalytic subunit A/Vma1